MLVIAWWKTHDMRWVEMLFKFALMSFGFASLTQVVVGRFLVVSQRKIRAGCYTWW
jgi:hypothetical protein